MSRLYVWPGLAGLIAAALVASPSVAAVAPAYHVTDRVAGPDGGWDYVRVNPLTDQVLVTRGSTVMAFSLDSGKVNPAFAHGARFHIALPVNDGREILLTDAGDDSNAPSAVFVDARSGAVLASVPTGKGPDAAGVEPRSGLVLVVDHSAGDVVVIDPRTHKGLGRINVGGTLEEVATDGAGRAYVNVEDKNEIAVLDVDHRTVVQRYRLTGCDGPSGLAYDTADRYLIAACDGAAVIVQARTGRVVGSVPIGKGADGVVFDARRRLALVPAGQDGTLSVIRISAAGGKLVQTLATRVSARTIGLDPRTGRVYLPSAEYLPRKSGERPQARPGSFRLIVVSP